MRRRTRACGAGVSITTGGRSPQRQVHSSSHLEYLYKSGRRRDHEGVDSSQTGPVAILRAETDSSRTALGERDFVRMTRFPFNVGRESRDSGFEKLKRELDRRLGHAANLNDLYLADRSEQGRNISREHFRIDWVDGRFALVDRGSTCGTLVGARKVGRDCPTNEVGLQDGDVIVVGSSSSPYVFRFQVERSQG